MPPERTVRFARCSAIGRSPHEIAVTGEGRREPGWSWRVHQAEFIAGRASWVQSNHHLLTGAAPVLRKHRWSILRAARGAEWFTSDHPALKLNIYSDGRHDFGGGWGNPITRLILPLSPTHLMYTHIGDPTGDARSRTDAGVSAGCLHDVLMIFT
jgi:hypothetical protein